MNIGKTTALGGKGLTLLELLKLLISVFSYGCSDLTSLNLEGWGGNFVTAFVKRDKGQLE